MENHKKWWEGKLCGAVEYATENFKMYIPKTELSENEIVKIANSLEWNCKFLDNSDYWTKEWLCAYIYKGEYKEVIIPILPQSEGIVLTHFQDDISEPKQT